RRTTWPAVATTNRARPAVYTIWPSGDDFDRSAEVHDTQFDGHILVALLELVAERMERLGVLGGLEGLVGLDLLAVGHHGGAAVPMGDRHNPLHFMQAVGDFEVVPEGLVPGGERGGDHADRAAGDIELAVEVLPAAPGHVFPGVGGEARV